MMSVGVPVKLLGGRGLLVALDLRQQRRVALVGLPLVEVQLRYLSGQAVEIVGVHVAGGLLALLVVEELGIIPEQLLLAGGVGSDLLGVEGLRFVGQPVAVQNDL